MKELLVNLSRYNAWANGRFIALLRTLSDEVMERDIVSSFLSLRKTVLHVWGSEDIWMQRLQGTAQPVWKALRFEGSNPELLDLWAASSAAFVSYTEGLDGDDFRRSIAVVNSKGEHYNDAVDAVLQHVVNHGTYHRGQLVTMLRQCGVTGIPATDLIAYARAGH